MNGYDFFSAAMVTSGVGYFPKNESDVVFRRRFQREPAESESPHAAQLTAHAVIGVCGTLNALPAVRLPAWPFFKGDAYGGNLTLGRG